MYPEISCPITSKFSLGYPTTANHVVNPNPYHQGPQYQNCSTLEKYRNVLQHSLRYLLLINNIVQLRI